MSVKYWVWLAELCGVSAVIKNALLERFITPEGVYFAKEDVCREIPGIRENDISALNDKNLAVAEAIIGNCEKNGYFIITKQDAAYPERLKNIFDPPLVLYVWGKLPQVDDEAAIGIVGTRGCTPYGVKNAERIAYEITRRGLLIITGLARGIDSAAAKGALRAGGKVVGVIGSGLDIYYPAENKALYEDISMVGAVISEYPPGTAAISAHFPARNRIISGLSLGVAVIEAPYRSGALITASRALEQGRDVFALPSNIDSYTGRGSNKLLREGAIPLLSAEDIVSEYAQLYPHRILPPEARENVPLSPKEQEKLLPKTKKRNAELTKNIDSAPDMDYIDRDNTFDTLQGAEKDAAVLIGVHPVHIDDIMASINRPAGDILSALTLLELKGIITQSPGKLFTRARLMK